MGRFSFPFFKAEADSYFFTPLSQNDLEQGVQNVGMSRQRKKGTDSSTFFLGRQRWGEVPRGWGTGSNSKSFLCWSLPMTPTVPHTLIFKIMTERYLLVSYKMSRLLSFGDKLKQAHLQAYREHTKECCGWATLGSFPSLF